LRLRNQLTTPDLAGLDRPLDRLVVGGIEMPAPHQRSRRLADHVLAAVAGDVLEGGIDVLQAELGVSDLDAVGRMLDGRSEQFVADAGADIVVDVQDDTVPGDVAVAEHARARDEAHPAWRRGTRLDLHLYVNRHHARGRLAQCRFQEGARLQRETSEQELGIAAQFLCGNTEHGHRPLADEGQRVGPVGAPDVAIASTRQAADDGQQLAVEIERLAQAIAGTVFCYRLSRLL
jgi:hypothetical protein